MKESRDGLKGSLKNEFVEFKLTISKKEYLFAIKHTNNLNFIRKQNYYYYNFFLDIRLQNIDIKLHVFLVNLGF